MVRIRSVAPGVMRRRKAVWWEGSRTSRGEGTAPRVGWAAGEVRLPGERVGGALTPMATGADGALARAGALISQLLPRPGAIEYFDARGLRLASV